MCFIQFEITFLKLDIFDGMQIQCVANGKTQEKKIIIVAERTRQRLEKGKKAHKSSCTIGDSVHIGSTIRFIKIH